MNLYVEARRTAWEDEAFLTRIKERVSELAVGEWNFSELCQLMHGAFPGDVLKAASDLGLDYPMEAPRCLDSSRLPHPSPAHGEWYFTPAAVQAVVSELQGEVLCLGAPSVAEYLGACGTRATLVDSSEWLTSRFNLREINVRQEQVASADLLNGYGSAVLDPPWYFPDLLHWIERASRLVVEGGRIVMPLLGSLTRPTAVEDRAKILDLAHAVGSVQLIRNRVSYIIPPYEVKALDALGIKLAAPWRHADLLIVTKERAVPYVTANRHLTTSSEWEDYRLGDHIVSVRHQQSESSRGRGFGMHEVPGVKDFTLDSVSRRDPRLMYANVWTCENSVGVLTHPDAFASALIAADRAGVHSVEEIRLLDSAHSEFLVEACTKLGVI